MEKLQAGMGPAPTVFDSAMLVYAVEFLVLASSSIDTVNLSTAKGKHPGNAPACFSMSNDASIHTRRIKSV